MFPVKIEAFVGNPESDHWFFASRTVPMSRAPCVGEFIQVSRHVSSVEDVEEVQWDFDGAPQVAISILVAGEDEQYLEHLAIHRKYLEADGWSIGPESIPLAALSGTVGSTDATQESV